VISPDLFSKVVTDFIAEAGDPALAT
jgi:hypothetical protein